MGIKDRYEPILSFLYVLSLVLSLFAVKIFRMLFQMLREAKEEAEEQAKQNEEFEEARKAHFGALFDDFSGELIKKYFYCYTDFCSHWFQVKIVTYFVLSHKAQNQLNLMFTNRFGPLGRLRNGF